MKKSFFILIAIFCLSFACKKESTNFSSFDLEFANLEDSIYYDSVSYAIINYSDYSEFKDTSDLRNPDIFSHSEKVEKQSPYNTMQYGITVTAEHTYVIKKFDLLSKSGKVLFYVPYGTQYYYRNGNRYPAPMTLPFVFKAFNGSMLGFYITKK
jgi:hypothetical protein